MKSALSQLENQANDPNHELTRQVKTNSGLKDDNQAKQYTQQAVSMLHEHVDSNPQDLHSAFGNVASNKGLDTGSLLGGLTGQNNSNSNQHGQKKQGIGDMLGF